MKLAYFSTIGPTSLSPFFTYLPPSHSLSHSLSYPSSLNKRLSYPFLASLPLLLIILLMSFTFTFSNFHLHKTDTANTFQSETATLDSPTIWTTLQVTNHNNRGTTLSLFFVCDSSSSHLVPTNQSSSYGIFSGSSLISLSTFYTLCNLLLTVYVNEAR